MNDTSWIIMNPEMYKLLEKRKRKQMKCCKDEFFVKVSDYRIVAELNDHIVVAELYDMTEEYKLKKSKIKSITFDEDDYTLIEMPENYIDRKGLTVE